MTIGLMPSTGFESFVTRAHKQAVMNLIDIIAEAQEEGNFSSDMSKRIGDACTVLTGLKYDINFVDVFNAYIYLVPSINTGGVNNIPLSLKPQEAERTARWLLSNIAKPVTGTFTYDERTGKFSGKGVEGIVFNVGIGRPLFDEFTPEELAAVLLHEVGHSWVSMKSIGSFTNSSLYALQATNMIMNGDRLSAKTKIDIIAFILKNLDEKANPALYKRLKEGNFKPVDVYTASLLITPHKMQAASGNQRGQEQRNEQGADQYVINLGLGRDLFTGVQKLGVKGRTRLEAAGLDFAPILIIIGSFLTGMPVIGALGVMVCLINGFYGEATFPYDRGHERLNKALHGTRGALKNAKDLDDEAKRKLLADIDFMEEKMKKMGDASSFFQYINPFYRRYRAHRSDEERIDQLINNPLFTSALRFQLS